MSFQRIVADLSLWINKAELSLSSFWLSSQIDDQPDSGSNRHWLAFTKRRLLIETSIETNEFEEQLA